ncbi:MAG TPA: hypothetical protein VGC39_06215, partial [Candidatus Methylacidiphilales bacterium]
VSAITASVSTYDTITVADSPAPWTSGELSTASPAQPYFVKFTSGQQEGRIIKVVNNGTNTLQLDVTDHTSQITPLMGNMNNSVAAFNVQVGDTFEIFPGQTLGTLFGTGTTQDPLNYLTGGSLTAFSDTVGIGTTSAAAVQSYYFNTSANVGYWELFGSTVNANNTVIYPYSTLSIFRRTAHGNGSFSVMGTVSGTPLLIKTIGNTAIYGSTQSAYDVSLSALNLGPNWKKGTSTGTSDTLGVWNPSPAPGHFDTYYQLSADSTWRKFPDSSMDVSSFVIPAGTALSILKRGSIASVNSYLAPPLPYNLSPSN